MKTPNDIKRPNIKSGSVGQFKSWRERMVHVSAQIITHPLYAMHREAGTLMNYSGPRWMVGRTSTYNVGSNKVKRVRRIVKHGKRMNRKFGGFAFYGV